MENPFQTFPILLCFLFFIFMTIKTIYSKKTTKTSSSSPKPPPGPKRFPIIGNLHLLMNGSLPHHCLRDLARKHGPLMLVHLGDVPHVVVSSPEIAKEIMTTHDLNFSQRPPLLISNKYYGVDIVFAHYGEYWRALRKLAKEEMLSSKAVKSFRWIREREVSKLVESLYSKSNSGLAVNLGKDICSLSYNITSIVAFGKKCKDQEAFVWNVKEAMEITAGFNLSEAFPKRKWLLWLIGSVTKFKKNVDSIEKILEVIINDRRAERAIPEKSESDRVSCVLDVLLDLQDNGGLEFKMEIEIIKAIILDIFIGGSDATHVTTEWAMAELIKNPRVMKKAQAEVRKVYGEQGNVDETRLGELIYLKSVIKETLRLHVPSPFLLPRESKESCIVNGFYIPAGTKLIINAWAIGRDPNYWTEPDRFYPERFIDSLVDFKGTNFEFIPFGAGRRMCPGALFATADIELVLAQLLFHFDWKLPGEANPEDLDLTERFRLNVNRKDDLYVIPVPYIRN